MTVSVNKIFVINSLKNGRVGKGAVEAFLGLVLNKNNLYKYIKLQNILNCDAGSLFAKLYKEIYVLEDGFETTADAGFYDLFNNAKLSRNQFLTTGGLLKDLILSEGVENHEGKVFNFGESFVEKMKSELNRMTKDENCLISVDVDFEDVGSQIFLTSLYNCINEEDMVIFVGDSAEQNDKYFTKIFTRHVLALKNNGIKVDSIFYSTTNNARINTGLLSKKFDVKKEMFLRFESDKNMFKAIHSCFTPEIKTFLSEKMNVKDFTEIQSEFENKYAAVLKKYENTLKLGLVSRYEKDDSAYNSLETALQIACNKAGFNAEIIYLHSKDASEILKSDQIKDIQGMIIPGGFGLSYYEGKLEYIRYARENKIPLLGICLGIQLIFIEFSRNVLGISEATSTEFSPNTNHPVVSKMPNVVCKNTQKGIFLGPYKINLQEEANDLFSGKNIQKFRYSFGLNKKYVTQAIEKGLKILGIAENDGYAIVKVENHPFMVGVQFHPELSSSFDKIDPIFTAFINEVKK